jgi:1-deoxy-D-xylulose-5-phosphate synthase
MLLDGVNSPADLKALPASQMADLAAEIRGLIVETVTRTSGHLGSNLGAVELTLAVHRVFDSPNDAILWDTGHQAYVHKLVTGRREVFSTLRQEGGLSGYPNRRESEHDWVENSHASTILSYAHGLATALELSGQDEEAGETEHGLRRVVAIVGDGALTGGMAYEALNNLGHSGRRVIIILNDNGRSYAPTVSRLSESLTRLRLNPSYMQARGRIKQVLQELPAVGSLAYSSVAGLTSALREVIEPHVFFEALGVRYTGPLDGHDVGVMEQAFRNAAEWEGPIVVHVLTEKGRGYAPAEDDDIQRLHDFKVQVPADAAGNGVATVDFNDAFGQALVEQGERRPEVVAITAAMPGPTGLLPFQARWPDRCFDVGIAEQHAVTAAAGMAMGGLRPIVAVYSTFLSRAFDQANLDVGMHRLPVVFVVPRAGITGDDGPSHHGILDLTQGLSIPDMTVFAPSSAREVGVMLESALDLAGPSMIRFPKTPSRTVPPGDVGSGMSARCLRQGDGSVCFLAVGTMVEAVLQAADLLAPELAATVWDVRVVRPADAAMLLDASNHRVVVTVEDGVRIGGAGTHLADALAQLDRGVKRPPVTSLGVPLQYLPHAKPASIHARLGLDGPGIAAAARHLLEAALTTPAGVETS